MARPPVSLHLPRPDGPPKAEGSILRRSRGRRRRRVRRLQQAAMGLLLGVGGVALLAGLVRLPERLDALLLVSQALANVIGGLSRLGLGLLQLGAVLVVVVLALLALLLLAGSVVRLWRALLPQAAGDVANTQSTARSALRAPESSPERPPPPLL
ncbi:MAG: hypothetical protein ACKOZW_05175 [Cyanobium sp.]